MPRETKPAWIRAVALFSVIVTEIVGGTVAGILAGYAAWKYLEWPRELMLFTGLAGFGLGLYRVVLVANRLWKETDKTTDHEENEPRR